MSASERKYEARQEELEDLARELLVEDGMSGFSIERIASRSGYSRPTIYQHFRSKDEALEKVALGCIQLLTDVVARGRAYEGPPWHRALAVVVAHEQIAHFHPSQFHIGESLGHPWIARRLPPGVLAKYKDFADLCISGYTGAFEEAVESGDFVLQPGTSLNQVTFSTISCLIGLYSSILKNRLCFQHASSATPWLDVLETVSSLWEGFGWVRHEGALPEIYDSIMRTCFPDYWVRAQTEILSAQVHLRPDREMAVSA